MGKPIRSARSASCRSCSGQWKVSVTYSRPCRNPQAPRDVEEPPLHDLPAAQPGPGALGSTLCRRVAQVPVVRDLERRILRTRGEAGALLRHVALDVGEDCFEFGLVADGLERWIKVAEVAPPRTPSGLCRLAKSGYGRRLVAPNGVNLDVGVCETVGTHPWHLADGLFAPVEQRQRQFTFTGLLQQVGKVYGGEDVPSVHPRLGQGQKLWERRCVTRARGPEVSLTEIRVS